MIDAPALDFTTTTTVVSSPIGTPPIDFNWTAHRADEVLFAVLDSSIGNFRCVCQVADDGAFTIPQDPCLGTTAGDLGITAFQRYSAEVAFNGRRLRIVASLSSESVIRRRP